MSHPLYRSFKAADFQRAPKPRHAEAGSRLIDQPGAVCAPVPPAVDSSFVAALSTLIVPQHNRGGFLFSEGGGGQVANQRNRLVEQALNEGAAWVLFIDSDHTFSPDLLVRLLRHDRDITVPLVTQRLPPFRLVAWEHFPISADASDDDLREAWTHARVLDRLPSCSGVSSRSLVELGAAGTGCVAIATRVFRALPKPWFQLGRFGDGAGEDTWFFLTARRAGFQIWLDPTTAVSHIGKMACWPTVDAYGRVTTEFRYDLDTKEAMSFQAAL